MSYIPANTLKIGDEIVLHRDVQSLAGTFTEGSIVTITDITTRGYSIADNLGHRMIKCGWDIGTKLIDITPKYLGYLEIYLAVYFDDGSAATAKTACDFTKPEGIKTMMDEFYETVKNLYANSENTIKSVEFISKEKYQELDKETEEDCHIQWSENDIQVIDHDDMD